MKTKLLTGLMLCFLSVSTFAQSPEKINYQAIVRDANNIAVANQAVSVLFTITESLPTGTVVYEETHNPTTNSYGLVNLKIGTGIATTGTFNSIDWSNNSYYLTSSIDPAGGTNYSLTAVSEMVSVPYALHAKTVEDKDDADADPNNEIQTLSLSGTTLTISGTTGPGSSVVIPSGGTDADADPHNEIQNLQLGAHILKITNHPTPTGIDLSPYLDNTDTQLTEAEVDAFVGNNGYLTTETDGSVTNELQTLSVSGTTLTISGVSGAGSSVTLPSGGSDADADPNNELQTLSLSGTTLTISGVSGAGSSVTLPSGGTDADADPNNEIQTVSTSGSTVTLSNSGGSFSINDADSDATNEIQTVSTSGSTVTLSNSGGSFSINDADADATNEIQTLSVSGNQLTISGASGNTVTLPSAGSSLKIGQTYQGGIIVHLNQDGVSGLIVAPNDLPSTYVYEPSNSFPYVPVAGAQDPKDGEANTAALVGNGSGSFDAAVACDNYTDGTYSDWFLPSVTQWILIYNNLYVLDGFDYTTGIYWTSTQTPGLGNTATSYYLSGSSNSSQAVSTALPVRPMRAF